MESKAFESYAKMLVELLGLQPGQGLMIKSEPANWPVVLALAEAAYERGAIYVMPEVDSSALHRVRVEHAPADSLGFISDERGCRQKQFLRDGWALISIKSPDDPDILAGIDPDRHSRVLAAQQEHDQPWREKLMSDEFQWLVAAAPTPKWAAKVLGTKASREAQLALWQLLKPILRLDSEDPVAFWRTQSDKLARRGKRLDRMGLRELQFTGPGTDLTIGLSERAIWTGGAATTPGGVRFMPNIPTEEVFTTPDFRKTEGVVRVTRPVMVLGDLVEGLELTFEGGKVITFSADRGEETMSRYLARDEGSAYLGEVALVDGSSPIYKSGHIFYNILLDENAACHIALGNAYPDCIEGGLEMSREELRAAGSNVSLQHTDFMIGSGQIDVTGRDDKGASIPIIREGSFVLGEEEM
ncbi:MAG: aminopeptidase [Alkalispirochaetaceae bacterium]